MSSCSWPPPRGLACPPSAGPAGLACSRARLTSPTAPSSRSAGLFTPLASASSSLPRYRTRGQAAGACLPPTKYAGKAAVGCCRPLITAYAARLAPEKWRFVPLGATFSPVGGRSARLEGASSRTERLLDRLEGASSGSVTEKALVESARMHIIPTKNPGWSGRRIKSTEYKWPRDTPRGQPR